MKWIFITLGIMVLLLPGILADPIIGTNPIQNKKNTTEWNNNANTNTLSTDVNGKPSGVTLSKPNNSFKLDAWNDEASMTIHYPQSITSNNIGTIGTNASSSVGGYLGGSVSNVITSDIVTYTSPSYDYKYYFLESGSLEWEIYLKSNLLFTNTIVFSVNFSEGLEFLYQPPLNEEVNVTGVNCNATDCWIGKNKSDIYTHRPLDVVGSYAVYYTKTGNKYKTGKAFHIYRPFIVNSSGSKAWCDLNITQNQLSITCPQSYMKTGSFIGPTFGYSTHGASGPYYGYLNPVGLVYNSLTASSGDTVTKIYYYGRASASRNGPFGIYNLTSDSYPEPDRLIHDAGALTSPINNSITEHSTDTFSAALTAGQKYGIVFARNTGSDLGKMYDSGSVRDSAIHNAASSTLPDPFMATTGLPDIRWSIWANYTAGSPPAVNCTPNINGNWTVNYNCTLNYNGTANFEILYINSSGSLNVSNTTLNVTRFVTKKASSGFNRWKLDENSSLKITK